MMTLPSEPVGFKMQTLENYTLPKQVDNEGYKKQLAEKQGNINDLLKEVESLDSRIKGLTRVLQENLDKAERNEVEFYIRERSSCKLSKEKLSEEIKVLQAAQAALGARWQKEIATEMQQKAIVKQDYIEFCKDLKKNEDCRLSLLTQIEEIDDVDAVFKAREQLKPIIQHIDKLYSVIPKIQNYLSLERTNGIQDAHEVALVSRVALVMKTCSEEEVKTKKVLKAPMQFLNASYNEESNVFCVTVKTTQTCLYEAIACSGSFSSLPPRVTLEIVAIPISQGINPVAKEVELSFFIERSLWRVNSGNFCIDVIMDTTEAKSKIIKTI